MLIIGKVYKVGIMVRKVDSSRRKISRVSHISILNLQDNPYTNLHLLT